MKATFRLFAAFLLGGATIMPGVSLAATERSERTNSSLRLADDETTEEETPPARTKAPPGRPSSKSAARKPTRVSEPPARTPSRSKSGVERMAYTEMRMAGGRAPSGSKRFGSPTASRANYQLESPFEESTAQPVPAEPEFVPVPRRSTTPPPSTAPSRTITPAPSRSRATAPVMEPGTFSEDEISFEGGFGEGFNFEECDGMPCDTCGPCRGPVYVRGEYLLWWLTGDSLPPLVTTSPTSTPQSTAGVLNQSTTSYLFGGSPVNNTGRSGARITAGWWTSPNTRLEADVFGLGGMTSGFNQFSSGDPIIARPFFNLSTGAPAAQLLAYPNTFAGGIDIHETSNFVGAGIHHVKSIYYDVARSGFRRRFDLLYGFRYLGLYENLTADATASTLGATLQTFDGFKTSNSFFGGNIGAGMESSRGRWTLMTIGRLGFGGTAERVAISGNSIATAPGGGSVASAGGLLAQPTNIGNYRHDVFSLLPQLEMKLSFMFSPNIRLMVGYDIMYWTRVVRPGQQIDEYINPTQAQGGTLIGTPGPVFRFQETQLLVQGLSTGVEIRF
ncbi:MAG: BBP7 family outer membrane beta-barrel protein [Singulisphaera sp.]